MPVAAGVLILLAFAAWRDVATRTIPDVVSLGILLLGAVTRLGEGWSALGVSVAVSVVLFSALLPFHGRGVLGGGDLKLLVALTAGLSPLVSYRLLLSVVLAGGVLAVTYLALRSAIGWLRPAARPVRRGRSTANRIIAIEFWRIRKGAPLPYGIAIAAGAAVVIGSGGV